MKHKYSVPLTMSLSVFGMFFLAAFWHTTVDNASIFLYISSWIGGGVGGLTQVLVMPFIALYKSDCLTSFRLGMDIGGILCALIAILQQPGSSNPLFGPSIYFCVFGVFVCLGMGAYRYILATGIGLTEEEKRAACASDKVDDKSVDMATMVDENPLYNKFLRHREFGGQEEKVELNLVKPENTQSGESPASRARARTIEVSIDNSDTRTTPDTRVTSRRRFYGELANSLG